ncbi:Zinc protease [Moritella viscosa]|uniref:M16 family metallopeptidase n=1 Tax=Moritella viscosa TaxID=80854 RepID=UPI00091BF22C|nr:insulinase family protein [Moritella viscosa]SGZ10791.1 Zinc protease [Moritella viscosa]
MLKTFLHITLLLGLTACTESFTMTAKHDLLSNGTDSGSMMLPYSDKIERGELANGLRYFIAENTKPENRVYIRLVVNAGSLNEEDDQSGVAHFVEHMAFNGTENFPGNSLIDKLVKTGMKFGVDINAFTDFENTVYQIDLPDNKPETLALALDVVADWVGRVTFFEDDFESERGVVIEEWRSRLGAQLRLGDKKSAYEMAGSHYLVRDPIGTVDSIYNVPLARVAAFYKRWYRPDNMSIVVGGDIDAQTLKSQLIEKLSYTAKPKTILDVIDYSVPLKSGWRVASITEKSRADSTLELSFFDKFEQDNSIKEFHQNLATNIAVKLLNIRFQKWEIEQAKLIDNATYFSTTVGRETTQHLFSLQLAEPEFELAATALFNMLAQIKQQGFLDDEFAAEKSHFKLKLSRLKLNVATDYSIDLVRDMVNSAATGQLILSKRDQYDLLSTALDELTIEQVDRAFLALLKSKSRLLLQVHPSGTIEHPLEANIVTNLWDQAMKTSQPTYQIVTVEAILPDAPADKGNLTLEKEWPELGIKEYRLSNGSKLIYKYSDLEKGSINFKATTEGGLMSIPSDDFHRLKIASELVGDTGIGALSLEQLRSLMDGRLIAFTTIIDDYTQGFSGWSRRQDLATLFNLFRSQLTDVKIAHDVLVKYQRDTSRRITEAGNDARDTFSREVSAARYPNQPTIYSLKLDELPTLTREQLIATYRQYILSKTDYTYYIVGDIEEANLLPLVKRYLASLPVNLTKHQFRQVITNTPKGRLTVAKNIEPSAEVEIYYQLPATWNLAQALQLEAGSELVQKQLRDKLREQASGVYGVASWFWQDDQDDNITAKIAFTCDPHRVDELLSLTYQVFDDVKRDGISATKLAELKRYSKDNYTRSLKSNMGWLDELTKSYRRFGTPVILDKQNVLIDTLTKPDIDQLLTNILVNGLHFEAVLTPKTKESDD